MGGIKMNTGFGNAPNGKWQGNPAGSDLVSNTISIFNDDKPPGCTNPPNTNNITAFLDSAASYKLMGRGTHVKESETQETKKTGHPKQVYNCDDRNPWVTLEETPRSRKKDIQGTRHPPQPDLSLLTSWCRMWGLYLQTQCRNRVWRRNPISRMERQTIQTLEIQPDFQGWEAKHTTHRYRIIWSIQWDGTISLRMQKNLIKYYHASLGSHPKRTLIEAENSGYLKGCPGLTSAAISKYVSVEDAMEMGHMK